MARVLADRSTSWLAAREPLVKVHNALVMHLRQLDHKYFEGFSLAKHPKPGQLSLYNQGLDG